MIFFIVMEMGTQEIAGQTTWQVSIANMITRTGSLHFTVQHIKVLFEIAQPLDLSKKLKINNLQLNLGNIQIRSSGLSTSDYLVEFFVNVVPNLLRYQIMDALEKPLMAKIQQFTDKIDVEQLVKEKFNEYQKTGTVNLNIKMEL
jgi:Group 7 allergen